jgi:hypothetical protein
MKIKKQLIFIAVAIALLAAGCAKPSSTINSAPTATTTPQAQSLNVYQTVQGSSLNQAAPYQLQQGKSALDLLQATHKVEVKDYAGIGAFVTGIDGMAPDNKHFWELFVNGKSSNVGASSFLPQNNDKIEWKLSTISATSGE